MSRWRAALATGLLAATLPLRADELAAEKIEFSRVAVLVYAQSKEAKKLVGSAQARLEQIFADNGVEVTDRDKTSKIKSIWKKLEDPGYFVTADDFVKNTRQYGLDGIARVYLTAGVAAAPAGFFSATAQADVRFVDDEAKARSQTSYPMGAAGRPPSDGLTEQAALINAVQRAVDEAAAALGLEVSQPASPRALSFSLDGPVEAPDTAEPLPRAEREPDADWIELAQLASGRNTTEAVTCAERAPGGDVAVVGGSLQQMAGRFMLFGSRMHLLDLAERKEVTVFDTRELGRKPKEHRGTSRVLDCLFVHSWRYVAAVTGDVLSLWDTERGVQLAEVLLPWGTEEGSLEVLRAGAAHYLRVRGGDEDQRAVYRVALKK